MTLVARIKVTLSDVEPQVLRRFDVPLKIKLNRLHDVIQAAMGWTDSHLYEFRPAAAAGACQIQMVFTMSRCPPPKPACLT
ncbi:plasmid pRiA4b ORF-3 family protein [Sulfitobacter sp. 1A15333]|uniref:plasmid pRiA4b ORF-3 family protein n=1 Tax=unclassified Sulfitobacter TaxID=196795 RepID=UPI003746997C